MTGLANRGLEVHRASQIAEEGQKTPETPAYLVGDSLDVKTGIYTFGVKIRKLRVKI